MQSHPIKHVPTNIITGFLGTGKTTMIRQLLQSKPVQERWAILVNEFGEIGIDGKFFEQQQTNDIFVREVPGGCMCCTSGLPMQIALNQLLAKAKPHRLLIEPTGLGHATEVLVSLSEEYYRDVLQLGTTIALVDARKVDVPRWRDHPTFQEQLKIADKIVATKSDQYMDGDLARLHSFLAGLGLQQTPVHISQHGHIDQSILAGNSAFNSPSSHHHAHTPEKTQIDIPAQLEADGKIRVTNQGQGFYSCGWVFPADQCFEFDEVMSVLSSVDVERLKAVFITEKGIFAFNFADNVLNCFELDESDDSRLEFICSDKGHAAQLSDRFECELFNKSN